MKRLLVLGMMLLTVWFAWAEVPKLELYLLIGQSNMAGRGKLTEENRLPADGVWKLDKHDHWVEATEPLHFDKDVAGAGLAMSFARALREKDPSVQIGLIPCAVGGSPLGRWMPGKDLYANAVRRAKIAQAQGTIKGVLWHQGESELGKREHRNSYAERLGKVVKALRSDLGLGDDVPFLAGELGSFLEKRGAGSSYPVVNAQIKSCEKTVPTFRCISAEGLSPNEDNLHFNTESLRLFGQRYAEACRELGQAKAPSVSSGVLTYEQFGAVGDGRTDDRAAIVRAHEAANEAGAAVRATDGKTYYLGPGEGTAIIRTDVDWGTAKFIIDDINVAKLDSHAFKVLPSQEPCEVKGVAPFKKGASRLEVALKADCLLAVENEKVRRYIRFGVNQNKGATQKEMLLVRKDGTVDPAAPVIWDFEAVTKATAYPIDAKRLTIKGGVFTTIANQCESKYTYHNRGIEVNRSNVLLEGIRHEITGEGDHGAPYGGFIQVRYAANVTVKDCVFTAHKLYWTQGHGGMSPMGSYDLTVNEAVNTSIVNCRQLTDIDDRRYWGLFASNYSKNILFDTVEFSRFDAHMGVANATILNSKLGHMGINAIGCGTFRVENTEVRGPGVFNLREDYGSTWEGEFIVRNCRLVPNGPRGGQPFLIRGTYSGKHDFGYVCHMPRKITFDGLVIDDAKAPEDYAGPYLFTDFNPENRSADYVEDYPYRLTEEVVLKNVTTTSGKPVQVSPNPWMFRNVKVTR